MFLPSQGSCKSLLGGSWLVISRVISGITIVTTHNRGLITPLITTHEPPSTEHWGELPAYWEASPPAAVGRPAESYKPTSDPAMSHDTIIMITIILTIIIIIASCHDDFKDNLRSSDLATKGPLTKLVDRHSLAWRSWILLRIQSQV